MDVLGTMFKYKNPGDLKQLESDGSRSGSSLSLRNIVGPVPGGAAVTPGGTSTTVTRNVQNQKQGVHRSISATNSTKPSRRASSGGESLREFVASNAAGARDYLQLPLSFSLL